MIELHEGFRLSPQQRRLWRRMCSDGGNAFRARMVVAIDGPFDRPRVSRALGELVEKFEVLRTEFRLLPGVSMPVQVIAEPVGPTIEEGIEPAEWLPQEIGAGLPLRCLLVPRGGNRHELVLELSSLCMDLAGLDNLFRELVRAYVAEPTADDAEPPMQYPDLAEWQNELLEGEEGQAGRDGWSQVDYAEISARALPGMKPSLGRFEKRTLPIATPNSTYASARALAQSEGVDLDVVLLAAWQAVLARSGDHPALAVALVCDGRRYAEVREALGLLARHLPLVFEVDDRITFRSRLGSLAEEVNDVRRRQAYFSWGGREEDAPRFRFAFEASILPEPILFEGTRFTLQERSATTDRAAVTLVATESAQGLAMEIRFDPAEVEESLARTISSRFVHLLASAVEDPEREVGLLGMFDAVERLSLLTELANGELPPGEPMPAHRRFEHWAREHGQLTALLWDGGEMSYETLDREANRLARSLLDLGVRAEVPVGILLERSSALIVAVLATLKAGGAFVPLDPDYPPQRLEYLLEASEAKLVIGDSKHLDSLPLGPGVRAFAIDEQREAIAANSAEAPGVDLDLSNLAYVLFTSGSTGRPKGVMISHAALDQYLRWLGSVYPVTPGEHHLLKTPLSFDVAVREIFWPLSYGATMVIAAPGGHRDSAYLASLIARREVVVANFVPSMLALFLDQPDVGNFRSLRRVLSGGEALPLFLRNRFFDLLPASLHNHYGPTETTITATACGLDPHDRRPTVSIGRPAAGAEVLVVNSAFEPVPLGVPGEIVIGGIGLARGYVGRPAATAAGFVPNPHATSTGERIYRTGDLARRVAGGDLEFLGRKDEQVKIRGFRIELGEIEHVLLAHEGVKMAVVTSAPDPRGDRSLAAYVVASAEGAMPKLAELREFLASRLPDFMVPSALALLPSLPRTPSGKIDRQALPAPNFGAAAEDRGFVEPRSPLEAEVASIWAEVLKLDRVGVEDDFFSLGGHSLLAMQIMSRLQEAFRTQLPLVLLFQAPTVDRLSAAMQELEERPGEMARIARALKRLRELSSADALAMLEEHSNAVSRGGT